MSRRVQRVDVVSEFRGMIVVIQLGGVELFIDGTCIIRGTFRGCHFFYFLFFFIRYLVVGEEEEVELGGQSSECRGKKET